MLLIHGLSTNGFDEFAPMAPLADEFRLMAPDRCGAGRSAETGRHAFADQARDIADLLEPGTHLLGTSFGGVIALLVAALRPKRIASLVLNEPVAFSLVPNDPDAQWMVEQFRPLVAAVAAGAPIETIGAAYDRAMLREPREGIATDQEWTDLRAAVLDPPPWEAKVDAKSVRRLSVPKLVTRGGWPEFAASPVARAFRAVSRGVAEAIDAPLIDIVEARHYPFDLPPVQAMLREFWRSA